MKMKWRIFLGVEALMLLLFGGIVYSIFDLQARYYENNALDCHSISNQLVNEWDQANYYNKQGIKPSDDINKSPEERLSDLYSYGVGKATYVIAKCYDENKKLIAEGGSVIEIYYFDDENMYLFPENYFSTEQMQPVYELNKVCGVLQVDRIEGYYEDGRYIMTSMKVSGTDIHGKGKSVQVENKDSHKKVVLGTDDGTKECIGIYGYFVNTLAKERPTHVDYQCLDDLVNIFAEKYEASRADSIKAYNEARFEELALNDSGSVVKGVVDGATGAFGYDEFLYNGKSYYIAYSILQDTKYEALTEAYVCTMYPYIFIILQIAAILLTILFNRINKKQKQLDEAKVVLTNGVAHELKTPIAVIKNYGECIQENINEEKNPSYLTSIINEADRMNNLVMQMLNYSRFSNEHYKLYKELTSLDELADEVIKEKKEAIHKKNLQVSITCNGSMEVNCDAKLIKMVIENYITNAIQHTPDNKKIEIVLRESRKRLRKVIVFKVNNEGSYIKDDINRSIWDVYYRDDKARSRKEGSTGFGLAICKHIIKLHHGKYGCFSNGNGMSFYFELKK